MVYFENLGLGFVYSVSEHSLFSFNRQFDFIHFLETSKNFLKAPHSMDQNSYYNKKFGKILRKNEEMKILLFNTGQKEIQIFFGIGSPKLKEHLVISEIPGTEIADFGVFHGPSNSMFVYTVDGFLMLYSYSMTSYSLMWKVHQSGGSYTGAVCSISPDNRFLTTCSEKVMHMGVLNIYEVSSNNQNLEWRGSLDMRKRPESSSPDDFLYGLRDINMGLFKEDYPLILGFQEVSDYMMVPFSFDGRELTVIDEPKPCQRSRIYRSVLYQESIWAIDNQGRIFRLSHVE